MLLLVLGIAQSVSAGTTTVTYHVDPSYMVLVPQTPRFHLTKNR